jgi:hypothetical protein
MTRLRRKTTVIAKNILKRRHLRLSLVSQIQLFCNWQILTELTAFFSIFIKLLCPRIHTAVIFVDLLEGSQAKSCIYVSYCSGQKTPDCSWGRLSKALGNWGSGNLEGGGFGERVGTGEVSLQATWDRGGRILSQLGGFQVSRRGLKRGARGDKGESARGEKKQGECAMYIVTCVRVYKRMLETFEWYQLCVYMIIIIIGMFVDNLNSV